MKIKKTVNSKNLCQKHNRIFGDYFEHSWKYRTHNLRICIICKEKEIYFGSNGVSEDWRSAF